ncbi:MAG: hypothetical protein WBB08_05370 [Halobacteriota archaeon]
MRKTVPSFIFLFLFFFVIAVATSGVSTVSSVTGEQKSSVMITGYQVNPEVLMCNDLGTVTVTVKNMEPKSVNIKEAQMLSQGIKVLSDSYFNPGSLGPLGDLSLTFTIKATCPDGIYYPKVIVNGEGAQSIRYSFPVTVDSSPLTIGVKDVPEDIFRGERAKIELVVGNSRPNNVTAVKIVSDDKDVMPSEVFIGTLSADDSEVAAFYLTPQESGDYVLNFKLQFKNGDNYHYTDLSVPLKVTESKKSAELILTGIEVESMPRMNVYKITGDINNAGLEAANSVVMKVGDAEGIEAMQPYKAYFVGLLNADDFSSFELNVKVGGNETQVPLLIEYKDEDGILFSEHEYIAIESSQGMTSTGELPVPMIAVVIVIAIVVIGMIAYSWKKR